MKKIGQPAPTPPPLHIRRTRHLVAALDAANATAERHGYEPASGADLVVTALRIAASSSAEAWERAAKGGA